jgi:hypothetical protein
MSTPPQPARALSTKAETVFAKKMQKPKSQSIFRKGGPGFAKDLALRKKSENSKT